jgi:hypothetical protein
MEHYNVLIATPGKLLHAEYVDSLIKTTQWLNSKGLTYKFLNKQSSFIPSGREMTALDVYQSQNDNLDNYVVGSKQYTYDKIIWIDSDIQWEVEDFEKIYESELDIIAGLYASHSDGTVACAVFHPEYLERGLERPAKTHEVMFFMRDEPVEVFGVGFGFMAVKFGVFENMDLPWFKIEHLEWDNLPFEINVGEDYSWCMNARRNGYKTFVDPTVKVLHNKETIYKLP